MDRKALLVSSVTGAVAQALLAVAGVFAPWVADNLYALGGACLAAAAGVIYARRAALRDRLLAGGALAGLLSAEAGIVLAVLLSAVPWNLILIGGLAGAVLGAAGAGGRRLLSDRTRKAPAKP
jgi:hypothetical protein